MKNEIRLLSLFVCLIALAIFFSGCGRKTNAPVVQNQPAQNYETIEQEEEQKIGRPWIEVVASGVFVVSNEQEKQALLTGDEITEGEIIETDKNGMANVYFPDGSVARMDSNTKIQILTGEYDYNSKTLKVKISLVTGNLWSKIIKLVTPESAWEVKTSNVVAAVRGSAFGASAKEKMTTIIGSEHIVAVSPLDPDKGSIIANQEASVGEKQILVIFLDDLAGFIAGNKNINNNVKLASDSIYQTNWVVASLQADNIINQRLLELQSQGLSEEQARIFYGEEVVKKFNPIFRQANESVSTETNVINKNILTEKQPTDNTPEADIDADNNDGEEVEADTIKTDENLLDVEQVTTTEEIDDTWSDIPISTDTNSNLGPYFIDVN